MRTMWLVAVFLAACRSEEPRPFPSFRHHELYEREQQEVNAFTVIDGDWKEDFGDASFYALGFLARAGETENNEGYRELAREVQARNADVITNPDLLNGDVNEILMSALGLIEYIAATGDRENLAKVDELIGTINGVVAALGHYLAAEAVPSYAMDTYGPTAVNALAALLSLQRAWVLGGDETRAMVDWAEQMGVQIEQRAWNGTFYEFNDGEIRPGLFLYPNISMIIFNCRLYQLTDDGAYRDRALAAYEGMQPLRITEDSDLAGPGRYRSPYSAEHMGATTDDYSTLSSQNYLMLALMLLYEVTGDASYLEQVDPVLDFIDQDLHGPWCASNFHRDACEPACAEEHACLEKSCVEDTCGTASLHHWMDGRIAQPEHPEYFCSGCNYQLLYLMWYRQNEVFGSR